MFDTAFAINPGFAEKLPYDAERDFAMVAYVYAKDLPLRLRGAELAFLKPRRDEIVLATKFGIVYDPDAPGNRGANGSPEYVRQACEALAYVHALSKRTELYGAYYSDVFKSPEGAEQTVYALGVRHRF